MTTGSGTGRIASSGAPIHHVIVVRDHGVGASRPHQPPGETRRLFREGGGGAGGVGSGCAAGSGGAGPWAAAGSGRSSVTVRPLMSSTADSGSTERNSHPASLSPCLTPVAVLRVSSNKIAIRLFLPIIVPTRVKGGAARRKRLCDHARGWRRSGGHGCLAGVARSGEERPIARRGELRKGNGPKRIAPRREFGRRAPRVGRGFAVHIGPGAFGLDRGERNRGRSRLGQARDLAGKNSDPGEGERRASHWDSRHCPDTTTRTRMGAPSASPNAWGACIARFSTKRYGIPASRS